VESPAGKDDAYVYDRMIRALVLSGFGDYETAASAALEDAAVFLFLGNTVDEKVNKWLNK